MPRIWGNYVQILSLRFRFGVARALPVFVQIHVSNTPVFSQSRLNKSPSSARAPSTKSYSSAGAFSTKSYLLARAPSTKCLFRLDPLQQNPRLARAFSKQIRSPPGLMQQNVRFLLDPSQQDNRFRPEPSQQKIPVLG